MNNKVIDLNFAKKSIESNLSDTEDNNSINTQIKAYSVPMSLIMNFHIDLAHLALGLTLNKDLEEVILNDLIMILNRMSDIAIFLDIDLIAEVQEIQLTAPDVITDDKTRIFENLVSLAYGARYYFDDNYIRIRMKFKFEVPKSYSKKKRLEALEGKIRPTKADIDNYIKSVLDGLNGRAFKDDRYIYAILAEKEYSEEAGIEVIIESV